MESLTTLELAAFILVNSIAALVGHASVAVAWPTQLPLLVPAALVGALIGSELAVRRLAPVTLRRVLGGGAGGCRRQAAVDRLGP